MGWRSPGGKARIQNPRWRGPAERRSEERSDDDRSGAGPRRRPARGSRRDAVDQAIRSTRRRDFTSAPHSYTFAGVK